MNPKQFTGHTPGTWLARTGSVIAGSKVLSFVHNHYHQGMTEAEAEANARLMAAAPDLLAENQRLREALINVKEIARQRFEYGVNPAAAMMLIDIEGLVNAALKEEV